MTLKVEYFGIYPNYTERCEGTRAEINAHMPKSIDIARVYLGVQETTC